MKKHIYQILLALCLPGWFLGCTKRAPELAREILYVSEQTQVSTEDQIQTNIGHIFFAKEDSTLIGYAHVESMAVNSPHFEKREIDTLITSIVITKEKEITSDTLYVLDKYGGFYASGIIDFQTGDHLYNYFAGIYLSIWGQDYFSADYFSNNGKNVSDNITIRWQPEKGRFELFRLPH